MNSVRTFAVGAAWALATGVFALDNTAVDDFWNTTAYVNGTVQTAASPALAAPVSTPTLADSGASVPNTADVFNSRWTTSNGAVLDKAFSSKYGALFIVIR